MRPPQEIFSLPALASIGANDYVAVANATASDAGTPAWSGRISGANIGSGSATAALSAVAATGALWFNGEDNASYARACLHAVPSGAVARNNFTVAFTFQCPTLETIRTNGHGLWVLSASDPAATLNASFSAWIRGSNGTGIGGSSKGDLIVRVQNASGGDISIVVSDFVDTYGGSVVRLRVSREVTSLDYIVRVFANGSIIATYANGTTNDFGESIGTGAFYFAYGFASRSGFACPFSGYIAQAAVIPAALTSAEACAQFDRDFPHPLDINHNASILFSQLVPTASELFNNASTHTWTNITKAGDSFTEDGGGAIVVSAGDSNSWATGRVNSSTYPGKLVLTASASSATNRCTLPSVCAIRRRYLVKLEVRQVSGTAADLLIGFDLNNRTTTVQNFRISPTSATATYYAVVSALATPTLFIALADDSAAAGQVYEVDNVQIFNQAASVFGDFSIGDGYIIRSLGTPGGDVTMSTLGNHDWIPRKKFAEHIVVTTTDQSITSSTTLANTGLTFRLPANATYAFELRGTFQLAGTASGYRFQLTTPTTPTHFRATGYIGNSAGNTNVEIQVDTAGSTLMNGSLANAARHEIRYTGTITTGADEGDLTLQMAQQVSDAAAITLERGSRIRLNRLA